MCKIEKRNSQRENRQPMEQTRGLFCTCDLLLITTPVPTLLANEFDVRSVLHGLVNLAVDDQVCVGHEAMNGCKNLIDSLKACFENVKIPL